MAREIIMRRRAQRSKSNLSHQDGYRQYRTKDFRAENGKIKMFESIKATHLILKILEAVVNVAPYSTLFQFSPLFEGNRQILHVVLKRNPEETPLTVESKTMLLNILTVLLKEPLNYVHLISPFPSKKTNDAPIDMLIQCFRDHRERGERTGTEMQAKPSVQKDNGASKLPLLIEELEWSVLLCDMRRAIVKLLSFLFMQHGGHVGILTIVRGQQGEETDEEREVLPRLIMLLYSQLELLGVYSESTVNPLRSDEEDGAVRCDLNFQQAKQKVQSRQVQLVKEIFMLLFVLLPTANLEIQVSGVRHIFLSVTTKLMSQQRFDGLRELGELATQMRKVLIASGCLDAKGHGYIVLSLSKL